MTGQENSSFFEKLYDDTYLPTARYVARRCADSARVPDILQDVYADVYAAILRRGEGYIRQGGAFVLRVAKAKLAQYYTRRREESDLVSLDAETEEDGTLNRLELLDTGTLSLEESAVNGELLREIMAWVGEEPPDVRRIFTLYYGFGVTTREIAGELGLKDATVRSKLHRVTEKLRTRLRKDGTAV